MAEDAVDFIEAGQGETVVLVHSSVAGARQWRSLMDTLSSDYHVVAINLFGYGRTTKWDGNRDQSLLDQAKLVEHVLPTGEDRISLVGHSFGGSVAMKAAAILQERVRKLVLIEYGKLVHPRFSTALVPSYPSRELSTSSRCLFSANLLAWPAGKTNKVQNSG